MRVSLLRLVVCLGVAVPAAAQDPADQFSGKTVTAVALLVERRPANEPQAANLVETRVGQPLRMSAVRESITHLYSLGRFEDVQVEAVETPGGVELRYNLVPVHLVERVDFTGSLGVSEGVLRRAMTERYGATPAVARAPDVVRTLQQLYGDHGYFRPTIVPASLELHDPDRTILTFKIDAGPQARIGRIDLVGETHATREQVLSRLEIAEGRPYERLEVQRRLGDYVTRLKGNGYYRATAEQLPSFSQDATSVNLAISIESGPIVTVTYQGDPLPAARLKELVPIERERTADEDFTEDSTFRIRDYLHQQGFWKADVTPTQTQADDRLTILFTIRKGLLYRVAPEGVEITGAKGIPVEELRPIVGLAPGETYTSARLDAAENAIRLEYRKRGFAWVEVKSATNELNPVKPGEGLVRPSLAIVEGPLAIVGEVILEGHAGIPEGELRALIGSRPGEAYYSPQAAADRDALVLEYLNRGYSAAEVTATPVVSADRSRVDVLFKIAEGPQTIVEHVIIVGNHRTKEQVIRRELLFRPGEPLGLSDLIESRRRLSALGLFRRVTITEVGASSNRDVLVTVQEASATSVSYGGGLEATKRQRAGANGQAEERLEFAPRGFFDIGRRNVGGRNRSVNLYTRVSLRPEDAPGDPEQDGRGLGFSDYRIVGTYREPRAFGLNADFTLTAAAEQGARTSFNFARKGVTAEFLRRLTPALRVSLRYSFGTTRTFDNRLSEEDQATIDRLFPQVRLSGFSGALFRDTRDDVVEPRRGYFMSAEGSIAARALGGQVGFAKTYLQGSWFRRIPGSRGIVVAGRTAVGLADGFAREETITGPDGNTVTAVVEDLPASERFFAGGDTTIRGFAVDSVGAPNTISPAGFPRGGNATVILNGELRIPVWREFGAVLFVDGGNVFNRVTELDFGELRGAAGFGVRYRSPIGPIRFDLGFKLDRKPGESAHVLHFSIGQAF
jgi:outer membrane protein assembly complex protein YaeT